MIFISVYKLLYSSFHVRSAVLCGAVWCMSRVEVLPPKAGRGKGGVAVHCAAGVSRASTSCIASLGFQMISAERSCKSFPRISMDFQATSLLIFISFCYFKLTGSCWYLHSAERERERAPNPFSAGLKWKIACPGSFGQSHFHGVITSHESCWGSRTENEHQSLLSLLVSIALSTHAFLNFENLGLDRALKRQYNSWGISWWKSTWLWKLPFGRCMPWGACFQTPSLTWFVGLL